MLLVDDYSRFMWVIMLKSKDEVIQAFRKVKASVELEADVKVKELCTNRGGEFTPNAVNQYCDEQGIRRFLTMPYTPQKNGVIERRNQTILTIVRSLLKGKHIPIEFWGEVVKTTVYLLNCAPT